MESPSATAPLTVPELTRRIAAQLKGLGPLEVEGELQGLKRAPSGHVYFDLVEGREARVACVVWKSQVRSAAGPTKPKDGDRVIVSGHLNVYAPRGNYSMVVERIRPVGVGALLAKLEALKTELADRGWFDRARPLPAFPRRVGLVTSRGGAALRDFLETRSRRWPGYPLRLRHSSVQGAAAAAEVAAAIADLDRSGVDLIVLARGGGSLEDLWCFNEERVLRAIWECRVPVVSGVGHQTDTTLADLVADVRAHTPTDAAQRVIPDRESWGDRYARTAGRLVDAIHERLEAQAERVERAGRSSVLRSADWILAHREAALRELRLRMDAGVQRRVDRARVALDPLRVRLERGSPRARVERWTRSTLTLGSRLKPAVQQRAHAAEGQLASLARGLEALSPVAVLARGYSVVRDAQGRAVRRADGIAVGQPLTLEFARGRARATVDAIEAQDQLEAGAEAS
jgi:exodeoxyribonuclease VII large subunit